MTLLIEFCGNRGLEVGENCYDGLLVRKSPVICQSFLDTASIFIKNQTGLCIKIVEKPLVFQDVPPFEVPPGKILLFDWDVVSVFPHHLLKKLVDAGISLGVFTNTHCSLMPIAQLEAMAGRILCLGEESCYEPSMAYRKQNHLKNDDKCKSLAMHFPVACEENRIRIIDGVPGRYLPNERHRVLLVTDFDKMVDRLLRDFNYTSRAFDDVSYLREEELIPIEGKPGCRSSPSCLRKGSNASLWPATWDRGSRMLQWT